MQLVVVHLIPFASIVQQHSLGQVEGSEFLLIAERELVCVRRANMVSPGCCPGRLETKSFDSFRHALRTDGMLGVRRGPCD